MNVPPAPQEFPTYRTSDFWPPFVLGWLLGMTLALVVRWLGQTLLTTPCEGHTLLALAVPLLLGPGGLGFTAANWRRPRRAALGLGLVVASLWPALYLGAQDIGKLRASGCAGGYVVLAPASPGGSGPGEGGSPESTSVTSISVAVGGSRSLTGRIGGFTPQTHPGTFTLSAQSSVPGVVVTLGTTQVKVGEVFPVSVAVQPGTGLNSYVVSVRARTSQGAQTVEAVGTLDVNVRPPTLP